MAPWVPVAGPVGRWVIAGFAVGFSSGFRGPLVLGPVFPALPVVPVALTVCVADALGTDVGLLGPCVLGPLGFPWLTAVAGVLAV